MAGFASAWIRRKSVIHFYFLVVGPVLRQIRQIAKTPIMHQTDPNRIAIGQLHVLCAAWKYVKPAPRTSIITPTPRIMRCPVDECCINSKVCCRLTFNSLSVNGMIINNGEIASLEDSIGMVAIYSSGGADQGGVRLCLCVLMTAEHPFSKKLFRFHADIPASETLANTDPQRDSVFTKSRPTRSTTLPAKSSTAANSAMMRRINPGEVSNALGRCLSRWIKCANES